MSALDILLREAAFYSTRIYEAYCPELENVIDSIPVNPDEVFTVCDYGAGSGKGSFELMSNIIKIVRNKHGDEKEISINYQDMPTNDFNELFRFLLDDTKQSPSGKSNRGILKHVFVSGIPGTFYEMCRPQSSVHLGFSAFAMHHLSQSPPGWEDKYILFEKNVSEESLQILRAQAAEDWETLLCLRGRELVKGGHLFISTSGKNDKEEYGGHSLAFPINFWENMREIFRAMFLEGRITEAEFNDKGYAAQLRTEDDIRKPFLDNDSRVTKLGLRIVSVETKDYPCLFNRFWKEKAYKTNAELETSVKSYIQWVRNWYAPCFKAFSSRTHAQQEEIKNDFCARYEKQLLAEPEKHGYNVVHNHVHIKKV